MVSTSFDSIFPKPQGAINSYVFDLSNKLSKWDSVSLFGRGTGQFHDKNFMVKPLSYYLPALFSKNNTLRDFSYSSVYFRHLIFEIQKLHKQNPINIFHIHNVYETPIAKLFKDIYKVKTVCSVHNILKSSLLMNYCDKILANSNYMKNFLVNNSHIKEKKITVLPIGVNINLFKPFLNAKSHIGLKNRNIILFIGRKVPYKGPQVLIDALPRICREYPNALAILIGPDYFFGSKSSSFSATLCHRAKELKVDKNVVMLGYVSESVLRMYLNAADVFVCPSLWQEPFGKVVIEANATEKPVVATNVGGLPEIVRDGENGLIIPPDNSNALSDAICYLLNNKKIARIMGKKGRAIVESNFSFEVISKKCQRVYNELFT